MRKAVSERWKSRPRTGRGGGLEYHISSLPAAARDVILSGERKPSALDEGKALGEGIRQAIEDDAALTQARRLGGASKLPSLPPAQREIVNARLQVIAALDRYLKNGTQTAFVTAFNTRLLELPDRCYELAVQRKAGLLSVSTVMRWRRLLATQGAAALAPQYGAASSRDYATSIDLDDEMRGLVLGLIYAMGAHVNAASVQEALRARVGEDVLPSKRTIERYIDRYRVSHRGASRYVESPDVWRNKQRASFGRRDDGIERPNQLWEVDSTIADVALLERLPNGKEATKRYSIVQVIDVWSRRVMFLVTRTSRSMAITLLFRRAMLAWGVPEVIRMDNGKDYSSDQLSLFLAGLQIQTLFCRPFQPQEKPHVERIFRTLQHNDMRLLPGFVGHSVPDQQKRRARERALARDGKAPIDLGTVKMEAQEFQGWLDAWAENIYGRRKHSALGMSPFERYQSYRGAIVIPDEHAVACLLFPVPGSERGKTVQKGGIKAGNVQYIAPELAGHTGEKVRCLYDPYDLRRISVFSDQTGDFICWAVNPETREERRDIAVAARRLQDQLLRDDLKELSTAAKKARVQDLYMEITVARSIEAARMQMMPKASELYTTPALEAAKQAMDAREAMDQEPALRLENDVETRAKIHSLTRPSDPLARPQYWDDDGHHYIWCRSVALASATLPAEDSAWAADYEERLRYPANDRLFRRRQGDSLAALH